MSVPNAQGRCGWESRLEKPGLKSFTAKDRVWRRRCCLLNPLAGPSPGVHTPAAGEWLDFGFKSKTGPKLWIY